MIDTHCDDLPSHPAQLITAYNVSAHLLHSTHVYHEYIDSSYCIPQHYQQLMNI